MASAQGSVNDSRMTFPIRILYSSISSSPQNSSEFYFRSLEISFSQILGAAKCLYQLETKRVLQLV